MSGAVPGGPRAATRERTGVLTIHELQARHIDYVLGLVRGNRSKAAELLGLSERTLYRYAKVRFNAAGDPCAPVTSVGYAAPRERLVWQYEGHRATADAGNGWTAVVKAGLGGMFTASLHHTGGATVQRPPLRDVAEAQGWAQRVYESTALAALAPALSSGDGPALAADGA